MLSTRHRAAPGSERCNSTAGPAPTIRTESRGPIVRLRRLKEQQLDLFADRTSTATMLGNQLQLWLASVAYVLVNELRRTGLANTELARAQAGTIRTRLLKVAARITLSVRRVVVSLSGVHPLKVFAQALGNIQRAYPLTG